MFLIKSHILMLSIFVICGSASASEFPGIEVGQYKLAKGDKKFCASEFEIKAENIESKEIAFGARSVMGIENMKFSAQSEFDKNCVSDASGTFEILPSETVLKDQATETCGGVLRSSSQRTARLSGSHIRFEEKNLESGKPESLTLCEWEKTHRKLPVKKAK